MATPGQVEYIEDLMQQSNLDLRALVELSGEEEWARYEALSFDEASEVIEWLKQYRHER